MGRFPSQSRESVRNSSHFSIRTKEELKEIINQSKAYLAKQPLGSALILTNVTNLNFDTEIIKLFMESTTSNKPYVMAGAIVGISGLQNIGLNAITRTALREIHSFDTEADAMDWLVQQYCSIIP
ncbi:MAG TPA: hypothetical protein VHY08_13155 [Bacillota bacterium]|nr:hypothetical protein [Bacillota bacterium]